MDNIKSSDISRQVLSSGTTVTIEHIPPTPMPPEAERAILLKCAFCGYSYTSDSPCHCHAFTPFKLALTRKGWLIYHLGLSFFGINFHWYKKGQRSATF